jgi:hypothetical protein
VTLSKTHLLVASLKLRLAMASTAKTMPGCSQAWLDG